jgi:hypothetical protein
MGMDLISVVMVADLTTDETGKNTVSLDWDAGLKFIETAPLDSLGWADLENMGYVNPEFDGEDTEIENLTENDVDDIRSTVQFALTDVRDTIEGWGRRMNSFDMFGKRFYFFACESYGDVDEIIDNASIIQFSDGLMKAIGFITDFSTPTIGADSNAVNVEYAKELS